MRRSRHCVTMTPISISTMFNQLVAERPSICLAPLHGTEPDTSGSRSQGEATMQHRAVINTKWTQWGAVVLLGSVSGCALLEEDWERAISGLEDRSGHANGGVPGGTNADAG